MTIEKRTYAFDGQVGDTVMRSYQNDIRVRVIIRPLANSVLLLFVHFFE